mgnify:CR=1 FL=1
MRVGDLVIEHIDDRVGTVVKVDKNRGIAHVLMSDSGGIAIFPLIYLVKHNENR